MDWGQWVGAAGGSAGLIALIGLLVRSLMRQGEGWEAIVAAQSKSLVDSERRARERAELAEADLRRMQDEFSDRRKWYVAEIALLRKELEDYKRGSL